LPSSSHHRVTFGTGLIVGLFVPSLSQAQPIPAWVDALAVGEWYAIPDTAMSSIEPDPEPPGASGAASKVIAWTSFVVDTRTSKVYSVANGGHYDYAGNEVDVLDLESSPPAWSQRLGPSPNAQLSECESYYADGRPTSRHSYWGVTLDTFDDRIMLFGGANWCAAGGFHDAISSYDIGSNVYTAASTHPDLPSPFWLLPSIAQDPSTGDVYVIKNKEIGRWARSSNTFATLDTTGEGAWGYTMAAFDTRRGRVFVLGGDDGDNHIYTVSSKAWTLATLTGPNVSSVASATQGGMFYLPTLDRYLVRRDDAGGTVYQVDGATFGVTTLPTSGGAEIPSTQNGPYNKFLYVPRLGGAVYVPTYGGNAWFLKLHDTDQTPPQAPTGLTVQ
jgi:hypothetical protein